MTNVLKFVTAPRIDHWQLLGACALVFFAVAALSLPWGRRR